MGALETGGAPVAVSGSDLVSGITLIRFDDLRKGLETVMPNRRFLLTVAVVLTAGWLLGQGTQAALVAAQSIPDDLCWRPGLARNIGIAEMPCP